MDNYSILGVSPTITEIELKKVYKKLAFKYHPDRNNGSQQASAKFIQIKTAYDAILLSRSKPKKPKPRPNPQPRTYRQRYAQGSINVKKIHLREDGSLLLRIHYLNVESIHFNNNTFNIPKSDIEANFVIKKEELREVDYKVAITFRSISGHILTKEWVIERPKLSIKQKVRKFFNLKY